MRVAADELLVAAPCNLFEIAAALLLEQKREEIDLKEQVAKFVQLLVRITGEDGIRNLVSLFERVGNDRRRGLLAIPRTLATQALGKPL